MASLIPFSTSFFPGYVLVKMIKTTESWYVVRNTRGVTGFVGPGSEPIPLTDEEYERMTSCQGTIRIDLEPGDNVRIKSGSVENAIGTVEEINAEGAQGQGLHRDPQPQDDGGVRHFRGGAPVSPLPGKTKQTTPGRPPVVEKGSFRQEMGVSPVCF